MIYTETTAVDKILKLKDRLRIIQGGSSAGKTIAILLVLIDYAQTHNNKVISVVSETFPHLKRGAIRDFLNIMEDPRPDHSYFELYGQDAWNKTDSIFVFPQTGSKIEFFSADQSDKVRGPRRDVLFINEANNIPYETYTQLAIRTNETIFIDYNPVTEFWVHTDIIPFLPHDFLILTYKDNEKLPEPIIKEIESRKEKKNWWRVYGEGLLGEAEGRIYTGWQLIDDVPHEARLTRYGLDFGYSNDPTAIVACYEYNGGRIYDEITYRKGLSNKDIADILKNVDEGLVKADSAEPKSIAEISQYGVNILAATKGKDSIAHGIQLIQDLKVSVTKRSTNLWKEYQNYLWETDKDGKILNVPQDFLNHCLDAIRYAEEDNHATFDEVDWEMHQQGILSNLRQRGY